MSFNNPFQHKLFYDSVIFKLLSRSRIRSLSFSVVVRPFHSLRDCCIPDCSVFDLQQETGRYSYSGCSVVLRAVLWDGDRKGHFIGLVRIKDLDDLVRMQDLSKAATSPGNCSLDSFCLLGHLQGT